VSSPETGEPDRPVVSHANEGRALVTEHSFELGEQRLVL
jgi:hypothetical protein